MDWAWHIFDAVTNARVGMVPMSSWDHVEDVSDPAGSFSGVVAPGRNATAERVNRDATIGDGSKVVVPFRKGSPLFTGWIPPRGRVGRKIAGAGLLSYLDRRFLRSTIAFAAVDQFDLVVTLVNYTQTPGGTGLGIATTGVGLSGVPRDQTWLASEGKNIGEAIRQKSKLIDGFEFDIVTELAEGVVRRQLRLWYPRRGRSQGGPVFRLGRGGNLLAVPEPAERDIVTAVYGLGVETDATLHTRLNYYAEAADRVARGLPVIEAGLNLSDVKVLGTLQDHVNGRLADVGIDELELSVNPDDPTWPWGSWGLGDYCQLLIPAGRPAAFVTVPGIPAHVSFPGPAGNHMTVPLVPPVDASFDARSEVLRPPNPVGAEYRWSDGPFYMRSIPTGMAFNFLDQAVTFPGVIVPYAILDALGLPPVGEWMQTRMAWDKTTDTLVSYFRPAILPIDDDTGWTTVATTVAAGSQFHNNIINYWAMGGETATLTMLGDARRWWASINGTLVVDVNMPVNMPANPNATSFVATTGQTVTVVRTGTPALQLVPATPPTLMTVDAGAQAFPMWPDGVNEQRRVVAHKWHHDARGERLKVVVGRTPT